MPTNSEADDPVWRISDPYLDCKGNHCEQVDWKLILSESKQEATSRASLLVASSS